MNIISYGWPIALLVVSHTIYQISANSVTMAMAITAVEVASVFMYKVGWNISIGSTVANILTAVALAGVGVLIYKEVVTANQLIGIGLCIAGLVVMSR